MGFFPINFSILNIFQYFLTTAPMPSSSADLCANSCFEVGNLSIMRVRVSGTSLAHQKSEEAIHAFRYGRLKYIYD